MSFISGVWLALAEGFGLALSPCILPILPFILASANGTSRIRPFLIITGFVLSFTAFSLLSRQLLSLFSIDQEHIQFGAYVLLFIFGLIMVIPFLESHFARLTGGIAATAQNATTSKNEAGILSALFIGGLIGLVWTPCAGPILAAALLEVIKASDLGDALTTILAFSIGAGIPMLMIALFGQYTTRYVRALSRHATMLRRVMGVIILFFAGLGISGVNLNQWIALQVKEAPVIVAEEKPFDAYTAPDITGITDWINTPELKMADLKDHVVLVDFWTYSCINCIRTLPHIEKWYESYKDKGFVVVGVHAPEFAFEAKTDNVQAAVKKFGLTYPLALDNNFVTWKNFKNQYWPAHYLIDQNGRVVYTHFGEGNYDVTENKIRGLLGLDAQVAQTPDPAATSWDQTPETYLGSQRAQSFASPETPEDIVKTYSLPTTPAMHRWGLIGSWKISGEHITTAAPSAKLRLNFRGGHVFLVMGHEGTSPIQARITLNGEPIATAAGKDVINGVVTINEQRLYEIVHQKNVKEGVLEIKGMGPGLNLYAFTFGV